MNAHNHAFIDPAPNWYRKSGIIGCDECDVCGFSVAVTGYDCIVCYLVHECSPTELAKIDPASLAEAFGHAIAAAKEAVNVG